jgi:hypothetical protein
MKIHFLPLGKMFGLSITGETAAPGGLRRRGIFMKKRKARIVLRVLAIVIGLGGCVFFFLRGVSLLEPLPLLFLSLWILTLLSVIGAKAAAYGAMVAIYILSSFVENEWPDSPVSGFFKVYAVYTVYFGLLYMLQALEKRKSKTADGEAKESAQKADGMPRKAGLPANSLLVRAFGYTLYQLFRGREALYVVRLGVEAEANSALEIASEEAFTPARGNEIIPLGDILEVRANPGRAFNPFLRIRARRRTRRFTFLEYTRREEVERFFEGLPVRILENGLRSRTEEPEPTDEQKRQFEPYRKISIALAVAGALSAALWLFTGGDNKLLEALNPALPVAAFLTYCAHFQALKPIKSGVRADFVYMSWGIPATALLTKCYFDFDISDPWSAAAPAALIALPAIALFAAFVWGGKPELNRVLSVLLCIVLFSALAVFRLNSLLDDGTQATFRTITVDYKSVDRNAFLPTRFLLNFHGKGEFDMIRAPRELYDALEDGDKVSIVTRTGALGIPYSFVQSLSGGGATPPP